MVAVLVFCGCGSSDQSKPEVVVTINPSTATVLAGTSKQYNATVSGSPNESVNWTIREGGAGGNITDSGLYTAPIIPGNYTVVATSLADPTRTGSAAIGVTDYPGEFRAAGALLTSHSFHSSTLLPDGKIFIGGDSDVLSDGKVTETYDVATGTSVRGPDLLLARYGHAGVLLPSGQVLIVGGYLGGTDGTTDTTDVYDPSSDTILAGPILPQASAYQSIAVLPDGSIVVAGGRDPNNIFAVDTVLIYDPSGGSFNSAGMLAYSVAGSSSTVLTDGRLLFAGGFGLIFKGELVSASEIYDPSLRQSVGSADMSVCREFHTATLLSNGTVLVAGGEASSPSPCSFETSPSPSPSSTMEIYDAVKGTFTRTGDMTTARVSHTATLLPNGKVLIVGGGSPTAEVYDPDTGVSTPTATMSASRSGHTATLLPDGRVVIIGGGPTTVEVFQ
jgi:WD40 repeat protein